MTLKWVTITLGENRPIILLTPEEFERVPDGVTFYDIFGLPSVKGVDHFDDDTRVGHLAYGIPEEQWNG